MSNKPRTPEQIVNLLRKIEVMLSQGKSITQALKEAGISDNTYYRYRKEFGGVKLEHIKKIKELETENSRLKKAVAELTLDKQILKEAATKN